VISEERAGGGFLNHLPAILKQRRWEVIVPFVLLTLAGIAAALLLPAYYKSTATLMVESQDLPEYVVKSSASSLVDRRVARLQERVLSRDNLLAVIRQHGLYPDEQQSQGLDAVIARVRGDVTVEPETIAGAYGAGTSTISLDLGFSYRDGVKAQAALQSLTDRFLQLNAAQSADQAASAVELLGTQAAELQGQLAQIEGQITSIKSQYGGVLSMADAMAPATGGSYDAQIMALQRDNNQLMQQARTVERDPVVVAAEAALANARGVYADTHPDVVTAQQRLREARTIAAQNGTGQSARSIAQAQIASNNAQIAALGRARAAEAARTASTTSAQSQAPAVMDRIAQLENRASILRTQYQEVSGRLLAARNMSTIEDRNLGERLTVSAAPSLPQEPSFPNRALLIIAGVLAGLVLGCLLAIAREMVVRPIRGAEQVEGITGVSPLVVVPIIKSGLFRRKLTAATNGQETSSATGRT
jgi:uncharacterized protein involved in exopolysaccharide biosynthesis